MVSAPQHSQHLQQAQDAGANVEDVFQCLSFQFLGRDLARDLRPVTRSAVAPSLFGKVGVLGRKLMPFGAMGRAAKSTPLWKGFAGQNVRHTHASIGALSNRVGLDAGLLHDVQKTMPDAFHINKDGISPVALLLFFRRPSAVFGAVTKIVVNAIDGVKRAWLRPHIGGKLSKRIPLWANADAAPAIGGPLLEVGVVAPVPHGRPSVVKRMGDFKWHLASPTVMREHNMALCLDQGEN